jgi:uncharacterized cupin superfamily protein
MNLSHIESLPDVEDGEVGVSRWMLAAVAGDRAERTQVGITRMEPGSATDLLAHDVPEFVLMLDGELLARIDGVEHRIGTGTFFLMRAGATHAFRNVSPAPARMLYAFGGDLTAHAGAHRRDTSKQKD